MRRCLQTATIALDFLLTGDRKVPIVAHAGWQENSDKPCDTGSPIPSLAAEFPHVDFTAVDPVYPDKTTPLGAHYAYTRSALLNRAQTSLRELYARPEKVIAVVSHSAFMRQAVTGCWFMNADYRVFDFAERAAADGAASEPYRLVQREETLVRGGGLGTSLREEVVLGSGLPEGAGRI